MHIITEHGIDVKEVREGQRLQRRAQAVPSVKVAVAERGLLVLLEGGVSRGFIVGEGSSISRSLAALSPLRCPLELPEDEPHSLGHGHGNIP
jgi:hypothetical protein